MHYRCASSGFSLVVSISYISRLYARQDTLNASSTLLGYFATALSQYASHEQTIREHMKKVRSREENLDELKRRRKTVITKAESAEKKLSKMSPEVSIQWIISGFDNQLQCVGLAQEPTTANGAVKQPTAADTKLGLGDHVG